MNAKPAERSDDWAASNFPDEGPLTGRWFFYALVGVPAILIIASMLMPCVNQVRPIARTVSLHSAVVQGDVARVRSFIQTGGRGFEINARIGHGQTPLMTASIRGKTKVIDYLLRSGADATLRNQDGLTALGLARAHGQRAAEKLLRARGVPE